MKSISNEHEEDRLHVPTISFNCGWYLLLRGTYEEAEVMQRSALEAREKVLGRGQPDTLNSVSNLRGALKGQDKYEEAEGMDRLALEGYVEVFGREHPEKLTSFNIF
jgi:hypothetical protein